MSRDGFPVGSTDRPRFPSPDHGSQRLLPTTPNRNPDNKESATRHYVTRQLVIDIADRLDERDRCLLQEVARLHLVSGKQLRRLFYADDDAGRRSARLDLARLTEWRVLARLERRIGGVRAGSEGYVYALDVLGQRLVDPKRARYRSPWTPGAPFVAHSLAVAELYVRLRERSVGEEFALLRFESEPSSWRSFTGPGGRRLTLKPDAFLVTVSGECESHYFIEVDRATESLPRITEKAQLYGRYWQSGREQEMRGVFPRVLWITPDERRLALILEVLAALDPEQWQLFAATTSEHSAEWLVAIGEASQ
jgi:Replication-relaxation